MALGNIVRVLDSLRPGICNIEPLHRQDDGLVDYGPHPQTILQEALRDGCARTPGEASGAWGLE